MATPVLSFAYGTFRGTIPGVHVAHLRLPPEGHQQPVPVVVNFHGGFWKTDWGLHNLQTEELLRSFGNDDVATWDVEYARVDQTDPASSAAGGGWPHTCLDALAAVNALAELPEPVRARLDLSRIYLCGHSAGAHLALWVAFVSRLAPAALDQLGAHVATLAGADAGRATQAGVVASLRILGVAGLAPVTSLSACAMTGLSDHHDAGCNFLWRLGPSASAANASGLLGAACPLALWCDMAAQQEEDDARQPAATDVTDASSSGELGLPPPPAVSATPTLPPLRILLLHGLADVDVPPSFALALATATWSLPRPPPLWLHLLAACDHYDVAGLCAPLAPGERDAALSAAKGGSESAAGAAETPAARPWAKAAAALRAFVAHDDEALDALGCGSRAEAERLVSQAVPPTQARQTLCLIATHDAEFKHRMEASPEAATVMARGLRRWYAWVSETPADAIQSWLDSKS